ncbi:MAG TPA: ATP-binding cassette domain-containing protein, partial [Opitutaceae bacterium]|nr:ATP-binding cassette domain-containing protein [Opitutaceae bacterium]
MSADLSVELKSVSKRYGAVAAVDGIDLQVQAGEFLTLLGPSGCGKTTLLRIIGGFEMPERGAVMLDGLNVTGVPPHRRSVNTVFQSYALFPHLTVTENVGFGLKMQRVAAAEAAKQIQEVLEL